MNIKSQWDYLGNAILIYEAREENSIQSPKVILYGMQKNQEFRECKLRLLHKLNGFDTLMYAFPDIHTSDSVSSTRVAMSLILVKISHADTRLARL